MTQRRLWLGLVLGLSCVGPPGPAGPAGERGATGTGGTSCTVRGNPDGSKVISCTDGTSVTVKDGQSATVTPEPAGAICVQGGVKIQVGTAQATYVCSGAGGLDATVIPELPGSNCATGGVKIQSGTAVTFACNGAPGAAGAAGTNAVVSMEAAGTNCPDGGVKLQVGAGLPSYVCHGAVGQAGASCSLTPNLPSPGSNTLSCGGTSVVVSNGLSATVTPEPTGTNCPTGGIRVQVGSGAPSYVCNGAVIPDGSTQAAAGRSCNTIHAAIPTGPDGTYWLDPDGGPTTNAFRAYCLMSRANGGWTKVAQFDNVTDLTGPGSVNPSGSWIAGTTGAGRLSAAAMALLWSRRVFLMRTASPSDGLFLGNGAGYMVWSATGTQAWPEFGTGQRPTAYTLGCERTGDDTLDATQSYTADSRADCAYGSFWLFDHNYTGDPICYGFTGSVFRSNLHFCGTTTSISSGNVTGMTQIYFRD